MAEELTNYQCPNCSAPLRFDGKSQKLVCDSCGSTFSVDQITALFEEKNAAAVSVDSEKKQAEAAAAMQWSAEEAEKMRSYECPSCGAQLVTDYTTAAASCPYCGNPTIVPKQFSGDLKPDMIIPFRLAKEDAVNKLKEFYKGKPFLPKSFTEENHIEEIKGVYVPFWLYDSTAYAKLQYQGTMVHSHTRGKDLVTVTEHYSVGRQGTVGFTSVPADASSSMPDDLMDSIEPFNYDDLRPFEMSYLPGYLANRYDVDSEENTKRVDPRMKNTAIDEIRSTITTPYASLTPVHENVTIHPGVVHYAFFPVWMLSTQYQGKNYIFACNGQTGKMVGDDLPVDTGKFIGTFVLITVIGIILFWVIFNVL